MYHQKLLKQTIGLVLAALILVGCVNTLVEPTVTPTLIPPTLTPTIVSPTQTPVSPTPTSTPTPVLATATPIPVPPTPTLAARGMNEDVCNENLCLTVTGAGDLGKKFVFNAPEGFHFLVISIRVENLTDTPLLYTALAEDIGIRGGEDLTVTLVAFIIGDSVVFSPGERAIDPGQAEGVVTLFAVPDDWTEFELVHNSLSPITLEVKETE